MCNIVGLIVLECRTNWLTLSYFFDAILYTSAFVRNCSAYTVSLTIGNISSSEVSSMWGFLRRFIVSSIFVARCLIIIMFVTARFLILLRRNIVVINVFPSSSVSTTSVSFMSIVRLWPFRLDSKYRSLNEFLEADAIIRPLLFPAEDRRSHWIPPDL